MDLLEQALVPLITVAEYAAAGADPRDLRIACAHGRLVRVRRGIYCHAGDWMPADERARHLIRVRAALLDIEREHLVAGVSAAAAWDLPILGPWPDEVTMLVRSRRGGTSEPGIRHTVASADSGFRAATELDGMPITSLGRTALDVARTLPFAAAVAVLDASLSTRRPHPTDLDELRLLYDDAAYARGGARLRRAIEFATPLSGSYGESEARAVIHELGFARPELQARFVDEEGVMDADFFWRGVAVVGEFDGKVKYTREEYSQGDPAEVAWREKRREDRLRRQVAGVVRILSADVAKPERLAKLLLEAGVPRERPGYVTRSRGARGSFAP